MLQSWSPTSVKTFVMGWRRKPGRPVLGGLWTDKPFKHHTCTVSTGRVEVGGSGVQGRPQLNGEFKTSPCLKKAINKSVFP